MFNFRKAEVREKIRNYLIEAAFDYAAECLGKENPTDEEVKQFVVDDIKRVMDWRMVCGIIPQATVVDYLQGLSLAVDYTYFDEWNRLNIWTGENNDIKEATDKELEYANTKYWNALACEILRWDRANRT